MKFNRVVVFGCSLIFGDELKDFEHLNKYRTSNLVWPALVAKHFNVPIVNRSLSAASNDFIFRELHRYMSYPKQPTYDWNIPAPIDFRAVHSPKDLVIVQWSGIDRIEQYNEKNNTEISINKYEQFHGTHNLMKNIITSDDQVKEKFLQHLNLTSLLLRHTMHIQCFGLTEPKYNNDDSPIRDTLPNIFVKNDNFLRFAKKHKFRCGPGSHPLEEAHESYSKYVITYIRDQYE